MGDAPRSRQEFLAHIKGSNQEFYRTQSIAGKPVMIEYLRGSPVPTGLKRMVSDDDGLLHEEPIMGRGEPVGVIVAYRDDIDRIRVGWSLRHREMETGIIIYRTGRRAGMVIEFAREVETNPFSKVEGVYRALRRSSSYYESRHPEPPSLIGKIGHVIRRFIDWERKRADKHQVENVAS